MAQRDDRTDEFVEVRIPAALADRIDRVYADCRGFEPSSKQESLSVLCDIAAGRLDVPNGSRIGSPIETATSAQRDAQPAVQVSAGEDGDGEHAQFSPEELDQQRRTDVDAAFPTRWSADRTVGARLAAVVERYVENPEGHAERESREAAALHAVGEDEGLPPDEFREFLVSALYGNTGLPDDLAGEFFSEALGAVADAADAADHPEGTGEDSVDERSETDTLGVARSPIFDDGPPALTDGPPANPARPAVDVDPEDAFDSPTDEVTVDSLLAEEAAPTARCERCDAYHPVDDLETVIGSKSATIELLCGSCTVAVEENC